MSSPTVNVVRYSALIGGIAYGIVHRRTLQAHENKKREHAAEHHRQHLIEEARKAWREQHKPKSTGGGEDLCLGLFGGTLAHIHTTVITNPDDPNFDLEKLLLSLESK
ncbi:hypothetical protein FRC17_010278 [Serendipita sp. 399]|nr:hypothetical protein FRC17_010278 [Serendipita sp. 399]